MYKQSLKTVDRPGSHQSTTRVQHTEIYSPVYTVDQDIHVVMHETWHYLPPVKDITEIVFTQF
jgi:hypothetical protein